LVPPDAGLPVLFPARDDIDDALVLGGKVDSFSPQLQAEI
jgi:hypothetical protein